MYVSRLALGVAAVALAACTAAPQAAPTTPAPATSPTPVASETAPSARPSYEVTSPTVWLCRPGMPDNPCLGDLDVTVIAPDGSTSTEPFVAAEDPGIDCFYVYPTVSSAPTTNAPLEAAPEIIRTARAQASAFQSVCRLFVPVYRQVTVQGLLDGAFSDPEARALANDDVVSAFRDYLNKDNGGRPFVLIGHSQGAMVLQSVIQSEVDGDDDLRSRMVAAMLIGGGPWLASGEDERGSFQNIPPCREAGQTGCLIAYNAYAETPPVTALFGRSADGRTVVCTNPGALGGGPAQPDPIVPAPSTDGEVSTLLRIEGAVVAECRANGTHTWLQVERTAGSRLPADAFAGGLGPDWGLHRLDVNLALAALVEIVAAAPR